MAAQAPYGQGPVCYVEAFNLEGEYVEGLDSKVEELDSKDLVASAMNVVLKNRDDCPKWTQWQDGLSLVDHQQILNANEERERERSRADRQWRRGVMGIGFALVVATVVGPLLATLLDNCISNGG